MRVNDATRAHRFPWQPTDTEATLHPGFLARAAVVAGRPWDLRPTDRSSLQGTDAIGVLVPYRSKVLQVVVHQVIQGFEGLLERSLQPNL